MSLFDGEPEGPSGPLRTAPLAERMRPRSLEELSGQEHLVGPGKPLRIQIERDDSGSHDFVGSARSGQNHTGQDHSRNHPRELHRVLRRHERHQGDQAGDGRRRPGLADALADHPFRG